MVSLSDHEDVQSVPPAPKRTFTFLNGDETRTVEATNVGDAWISLSFLEDVEAEELVERGWKVKFK